jgi:hypothetical protein
MQLSGLSIRLLSGLSVKWQRFNSFIFRLGEGPVGRGNRLENGWGIKPFAGSIPVLSARLYSSVVEHFSHKEAVGGSNPPTTTVYVA